MGIKFKSEKHTRIFFLCLTGGGLGIYFFPVIYHSIIRPYKERHGYYVKPPLAKPALYPFVMHSPRPYISSAKSEANDSSSGEST